MSRQGRLPWPWLRERRRARPHDELSRRSFIPLPARLISCGSPSSRQSLAPHSPPPVALPLQERQKFTRQLSHPMTRTDYVRRSAVFKKIFERCKKVHECPYCQAVNGTVKKVGCMRVVHERYKEKDKERFREMRMHFLDSFEQVSQLPKGSFENSQLSGADIQALREMPTGVWG